MTCQADPGLRFDAIQRWIASRRLPTVKRGKKNVMTTPPRKVHLESRPRSQYPHWSVTTSVDPSENLYIAAHSVVRVHFATMNALYHTDKYRIGKKGTSVTGLE